MRIGLIGFQGTVGQSLLKLGYEPIPLDVTNQEQVERSINRASPDLLIYAAGYTNVDKCDENYQEALAVNARGVDNIVRFYKGRLLYISTDHVFSGRQWFNDGYSERHNPNPVNVYGITKRAGEMIALNGWSDSRIIRTSKLFNQEYVDNRLSNLPKEFSNVLKRSFLHVDHFAEGINWVVNNWDKCPETLHISGTDILSHYLFFFLLANHFGMDTDLIKKRNTYLKSMVDRPARVGLNTSYAQSLGVPLYSAHDGMELLENKYGI